MSENGRVSNGPDDPVRTKILKIDIWLEARECQAPYAWGGRLVSALGGARLAADDSSPCFVAAEPLIGDGSPGLARVDHVGVEGC